MNLNLFLNFLSFQSLSLFLNEIVINENYQLVNLFYDETFENSGLFGEINKISETYAQWVMFDVRTLAVKDLYVQNSDFYHKTLLLYAVEPKNVLQITELTKNLSHSMAFLFTPNSLKSKGESMATITKLMSNLTLYKVRIIYLAPNNKIETYTPQNINNLFQNNSALVPTSHRPKKNPMVNFQMNFKPPKIRYCSVKSCNFFVTGSQFFLINFIATQLNQKHFFTITNSTSNTSVSFVPRGDRVIYNELMRSYREEKINLDGHYHVVQMSASNGQYDINRDANFLLTDEYENIVVIIVANSEPFYHVKRSSLLITVPVRICVLLTSGLVLFWIRRCQRLRHNSFFSAMFRVFAITFHQSIRIIDQPRSANILIGTLLFGAIVYNTWLSNHLLLAYAVHTSDRSINTIEELKTRKIPVFLNKADIHGSDFIKENIMNRLGTEITEYHLSKYDLIRDSNSSFAVITSEVHAKYYIEQIETKKILYKPKDLYMLKEIITTMRIKVQTVPAYLGSKIKKIVFDATEFGFIEFYKRFDENSQKIQKFESINKEGSASRYIAKSIGMKELRYYFICYFVFNVFALFVFVGEIIYFRLLTQRNANEIKNKRKYTNE